MLELCRTVKELKEFLVPFNDDDNVWAYEGECQGVIVAHKNKCYVFDNYNPEDDDTY